MTCRVSEKMKIKVKKIGGVFLCTVAAVGLIGCGGGNKNVTGSPSVAAEQNADLKIDVTSLASDIFNAGEYKDELTELKQDMFDAVFQTVDWSTVTAKAAYVGSGASAEQIVVAEAKDEKAALGIKDALKQKVQDDIDSNQNYLPEEVSKLKNPVLQAKGKYVVLCVSDDNKKIEQVLQKNGIQSE